MGERSSTNKATAVRRFKSIPYPLTQSLPTPASGHTGCYRWLTAASRCWAPPHWLGLRGSWRPQASCLRFWAVFLISPTCCRNIITIIYAMLNDVQTVLKILGTTDINAFTTPINSRTVFVLLFYQNKHPINRNLPTWYRKCGPSLPHHACKIFLQSRIY